LLGSFQKELEKMKSLEHKLTQITQAYDVTMVECHEIIVFCLDMAMLSKNFDERLKVVEDLLKSDVVIVRD
jgi:hypothetical protein